jgi:alpha-mannosidase
MTSPQWFEELHDPFCAQSLVDLVADGGAGLLILHEGSQQWFKRGRGVRALLTTFDPWDEQRYSGRVLAGFRLVPHLERLSNADRIRRAAEYRSCFAHCDPSAVPVGGGTAGGGNPKAKLPPIPKSFGMLEVCDAPGVLAHALYRDSMKTGEHLPDWAGHEMARRSDGACTHPVVIRLVEWNGEPAEVTLKLPGPIAAAAKTNLLGEVGPASRIGGGEDTAWLEVEKTTPPAWAKGAKVGGRAVAWSQLRFRMRPREIATIVADVVMARKQWRDLDEKRKVWATVHKTKATKATKRRSDGATKGKRRTGR